MVFPSSTMTSRALIGSLRPTAKSVPTVLFGESPIWFSFDAEMDSPLFPSMPSKTQASVRAAIASHAIPRCLTKLSVQTSRRGHEFCIGSRTASGSALAAPAWRANVTPIRRPDCQRHASYSVLVVLTCKREHVWNTGSAFDFEARAVAPQIADRAVDSHPELYATVAPFNVRRRGFVSALAFDKHLQLANHICVRHRELVLEVT